MLRVGQLRFAWSPPEWVVATSLCQSAGRYPPPHGILKENLLWVRTFDTIEELRAALVKFATRYNETWLVARHGYRTPAKVRPDQCRIDQNATADQKILSIRSRRPPSGQRPKQADEQHVCCGEKGKKRES